MIFVQEIHCCSLFLGANRNLLLDALFQGNQGLGIYYPAEVWISEYGKLYAKYEYQDEIECFPDVFALIERELRQCKFDSAAMKTVEALDGKI